MPWTLDARDFLFSRMRGTNQYRARLLATRMVPLHRMDAPNPDWLDEYFNLLEMMEEPVFSIWTPLAPSTPERVDESSVKRE